MAGWAARREDAVEVRLARALWRRGWRPLVVPYLGYGASHADGHGWVRVLARVLLAPVRAKEAERQGRRGWRHFLTLSLDRVPVAVEVGDRHHVVRSDRSGYVDAVLPADLPPGWHELTLRTAEDRPTKARVRMVGPDEQRAVVSDIDDTVMVTAIPRPLLAFWNSFVRQEAARQPAPGMAAMLQRLQAQGPEAMVVYVSTGAWNVAPSIRRFLARHGYPPGPLLMTDWGPTDTGWFRSGREHKRTTLRRLLRELPWLRWSLVGDDGQHDPQLYDELAAEAPGRVELIAIRQLTATEHVLTHGVPEPRPDARPDARPSGSDGRPPDGAGDVLRLRAPDGHRLLAALDLARQGR